MVERIQKILAARGLCSRREAEAWISAGRVSCNGIVCTLGQSADPEVDEICVDGETIPVTEEKVYIMLHKPKGYVTTLSDERGRKNVSDLVSNCGKRIYPVGRLDMESEGLLFMTNDGEFANKMMHPSHNVEKIYRVTVKNFSAEGIARLMKPIILDGHTLRKPDVTIENTSDGIFLITIHEGRNRQVRRMCAIAGMPVKRLVRIQEGSVKLGDLVSGSWRYLTCDEVSSLLK